MIVSKDVRFLKEIGFNNESNPSELVIDIEDTGREINSKIEHESNDIDFMIPSVPEAGPEQKVEKECRAEDARIVRTGGIGRPRK